MPGILKGLRRTASALLLCALLLPFVCMSVSSASDGDPLMYINNSAWYKETSLSYVKIYNLYYVPMSMFAMLDNVEIVENVRLSTTMIRYGNNKYFSFDTETGEFAYTEESGQFYLKTYLLYTDRYVPVELICDYFGFRYETYENNGKLAMRISNAANSNTIEDLLKNYNPSMLKPAETTPSPITIPEPVIGERTIYLTFEDAPNEYTAQILDILGEYGRSATFFVTGDQAAAYPELIRRMLVEGHTVGLHTMSGDEDFADSSELIASLERENELLYKIVKQRFRLLRLPEGSLSASAIIGGEGIAALSEAGYALWDWNVDALDTAQTTYSRIIYRATNGINTNDTPILRFHSAALTVRALPGVLDYIAGNENFSVAALSPAIAARITNYSDV